MRVTQEDLFGSDEFEEMSNEITDHRRWCVVHTIIVMRVKDGTFWRGHYERGATEYQDGGYDGDVELTQVYPVETTVIVYMNYRQLHAHVEKTIPND